jgi:hypothetical protein
MECSGEQARFPAWRGRLVVLCNPGIKIALQLGDRVIKLVSERDAVELVQQRLVETLANAVRLRAPRLRWRVIDVLDGQIQLELVVVRLVAELSVPQSVSTRLTAISCPDRLLADRCLDPPTPSASPARLLSNPTYWP